MNLYIVAAIFARGGSKGLPGKNIKVLAGKPLIAHAIETAKSAEGIDAVIVSTDDDEIAAVARQWGAEVPFMRPPHLATDDAPEILAWRHAMETYEQLKSRPIDVLVSVPTTAPLRKAQDVNLCLEMLLNSDADVVITVTPAHRNPYFNMVTLDENGHACKVINQGMITSRQKAPVVYDVTTVCYAARASFVRSGKHIFEAKVKATVIPVERSLDIDTPLDFELAEFFMQRKAGHENSRSIDES